MAQSNPEYQPIIKTIFDKYLFIGDSYIGNLKTVGEVNLALQQMENEIKFNLTDYEIEKSIVFYEQKTSYYLGITVESEIKTQLFLSDFLDFSFIFEKHLHHDSGKIINASYEHISDFRAEMGLDIEEDAINGAKNLRIYELSSYINLLIENNKKQYCALEMSHLVVCLPIGNRS